MLLFDAIITFFKSFNTSSQHFTFVLIFLIFIYSNFDVYMQKIYSSMFINKFIFFLVSCRCHNKNNCKYIYLLCNNWFFKNKTYANEYLTKIHFFHALKFNLK